MSSNLKSEFNQNESYPDFFNQLEAEVQGKKNIWDIKWYSTVMLNKGLTLYPRKSLVENIGFDGSGSNYVENIKGFSISLEGEEITSFPLEVAENSLARKHAEKYFNSQKPSFWDKAIYKLKLIFKLK